MIIGISGKKHSGKSTVALMLQSLRPNTIIVNFADPLKEECAKVLGKTPAWIEQNKTRLRPFLQWYGTDYRRYYEGEDYWVKRWVEKVGGIQFWGGPKNIIAADVRFPNEAKAIEDFGGYIIRVERPFLDDVKDEHVSENAMNDYPFDLIIKNDGTLEQLEEQVRNMKI